MSRQLSPLPPGTPAPNFTLPRSSYASVSLADARGHRVILVFYPADWEPVSEQQLTLYQAYLAAFARLGAVLLAVSTDHIWCHGAFARAAGLHYPLLADVQPRGRVARQYGVFREAQGVSARALFVLDAQRVIQFSKAYPDQLNPGVDELLTTLEALAAEAADGDERAGES